ncbi:hypothetical protein C731_4081 [Mycolicibacterium hassiacum DSM 44199]|jgi:hypothetical protein|uniref:Uncharacterized protein n=1 Tax=Mycolicibacterium hassiacum (strain DSM 44199 / CIP 105218 / JCM 12690 / 3849) TaxID=1122247 RepID=K5BE33_MYCHD|nr:hypothetical protein [Mycolicibacterium hassiacum]EKF21941.1 hypothetical protein C731_4081 [Mycolicibacterium hassiacum DSM 44199]MBX5486971.1 hypothetical protein [Mycolicibacterium hassiacum]VCT92789.1 hypothetical protein MHAS_04521 [Mycolicibacterium hassiacum DSM 44199]
MYPRNPGPQDPAPAPFPQPVPPVLPYPECPEQPGSAWPPGRIVDLVATAVLFAVYTVGLLLLLWFSLFWVMGTDVCAYKDECPIEDRLPMAYLVHDGLGIVVFAVLLIVAIIRLIRARRSFWLPLVGMAIQAALLVLVLKTMLVMPD